MKRVRAGILAVFISSSGGISAADDAALPAVVITARAEEPALAPDVSQFRGEALRELGLTSLGQLDALAPNVSLRSLGDQSLNNVLSIRGNANTPFFSPQAVAVYQDDVSFASVFSIPPLLVAPETVTVLRGPQIWSYGRPAPGGVIAIENAPPSREWSAAAQARWGDFDSRGYLFGISGPLVPGRLSFSAGGQKTSRDGYLDNRFLKTRPDSQDSTVGRAALLWEATDRLSVELSGLLENHDAGSSRLAPLDDEPRQTASNFDGHTPSRADLAALRVRYRGEDAELLSVTSRRDWHLGGSALDYDFSPAPLAISELDVREREWAHEMRVESPRHRGVNAWHWLAGLFGSHVDRQRLEFTSLRIPLPVPFLPPLEIAREARVEEEVRQGALFGQVTAPLGDAWSLTLGLRGDAAEKTAERRRVDETSASTREERTQTFRSFSPMLELAWQPAPGWKTTARSSLAPRTGGSSAFLANPTLSTYASERTWSNELSLQSPWLAGKLRFGLAAFWNEIRHFQYEQYDALAVALFNAERARVRGLETEALWLPLAGLELRLAAGWMQAVFTRHHDPATGEDQAGNRVPNLPEWTLALGAQYRWARHWVARVDWVAQGETYYSPANEARFRQAPFGQVHAHFGYEAAHWSLGLEGRNLTDAEYYSLEIPSLDVGAPGDPRTLAVVLGLRW